MTAPMLPRPVAPSPRPATPPVPAAPMPSSMGGEQPGAEKVTCPKCGLVFDPEAAKEAGKGEPAGAGGDLRSFFATHSPSAAMSRPAGPMP